MGEYDGIHWSLRLAQFLEASSEIPTDINFKIEDETKEEKNVKAHRMVMGMASPAFRKMLFVTRTDDKVAEEISVEETSEAAFRAMVEAIYNTKTIKESLKEKTVHEMFAVLNLVKKYQIPELVLPARDCLATFPLTEEVVLEVAGDAMKYLNTFDEEAKELLIHCAKFLKPKFVGENSVFKFTAANKERGDILLELFALMDNIKPEKCENCIQTQCKDGQEVTEGEFYVGLRIICNNSKGYWVSDIVGNRGTVASIVPGSVTLKDCQAGSANLYIDSSGNYKVNHNGRSTFSYYCKTA